MDISCEAGNLKADARRTRYFADQKTDELPLVKNLMGAINLDEMLALFRGRRSMVRADVPLMLRMLERSNGDKCGSDVVVTPISRGQRYLI